MSEPTTDLKDLVMDYLSRAPATTSNVASHFGLSLDDAFWVLASLSDRGMVRTQRNDLWRAVDHG